MIIAAIVAVGGKALGQHDAEVGVDVGGQCHTIQIGVLHLVEKAGLGVEACREVFDLFWGRGDIQKRCGDAVGCQEARLFDDAGPTAHRAVERDESVDARVFSRSHDIGQPAPAEADCGNMTGVCIGQGLCVAD